MSSKIFDGTYLAPKTTLLIRGSGTGPKSRTMLLGVAPFPLLELSTEGWIKDEIWIADLTIMPVRAFDCHEFTRGCQANDIFLTKWDLRTMREIKR